MAAKFNAGDHTSHRGDNPPALSESLGGIGCYPGGPRGPGGPCGEEEEPERDLGTHPIRGVSDMERRREMSRLDGRVRGRRRHAIEVVIVALTLALSAGAFVGFQGHETAEEIAGESVVEQGEADIEKEAARLLSELWKMEDLDRLRIP